MLDAMSMADGCGNYPLAVYGDVIGKGDTRIVVSTR